MHAAAWQSGSQLGEELFDEVELGLLVGVKCTWRRWWQVSLRLTWGSGVWLVRAPVPAGLAAGGGA